MRWRSFWHCSVRPWLCRRRPAPRVVTLVTTSTVIALIRSRSDARPPSAGGAGKKGHSRVRFFAGLVYSESAMRPMQDIDLLVRSRDVDAAGAALRGLGYASDELCPARSTRNTITAPHGICHVRTLVIELHLANQLIRLPIPFDHFWQRARPAPLGVCRSSGLEALMTCCCLLLNCA